MKNEISAALLECFTPVLRMTVEDIAAKNICEEIHISRNKKVFLKLQKGIKFTEHTVDSVEFDLIFKKLCRNSLYTQSENIKRGFISFEGMRVGVAGRAVCEGDKLISVGDIESLNIRIPHYPRGVGEPLVAILEHYNFLKGILIYSPPMMGKTTLLRDTARILSSFPYYKRVSLIDTRGELYLPYENCGETLDTYKFYPPHTAIECAVRTMSPEIVICDEIGGREETEALFYSSNKGVPIIASAHGESISRLLKNENINILHKTGMFSCYVGIKRDKNNKMTYDITPWELASAESGEKS